MWQKTAFIDVFKCCCKRFFSENEACRAKMIIPTYCESFSNCNICQNNFIVQPLSRLKVVLLQLFQKQHNYHNWNVEGFSKGESSSAHIMFCLSSEMYVVSSRVHLRHIHTCLDYTLWSRPPQATVLLVKQDNTHIMIVILLCISLSDCTAS